MSLREELLKLFDEDRVNALIQQYHALVQVNSGWRIGGFVSLCKAGINGGMG